MDIAKQGTYFQVHPDNFQVVLYHWNKKQWNHFFGLLSALNSSWTVAANGWCVLWRWMDHNYSGLLVWLCLSLNSSQLFRIPQKMIQTWRMNGLYSGLLVWLCVLFGPVLFNRIQSLEQPLIICPTSFNLILQQDNYNLHLTHEPLSPLV